MHALLLLISKNYVPTNTQRRLCNTLCLCAFICLPLLTACTSFTSHNELMTSVLEVRDTQGAFVAVEEFQASHPKQLNLLYALEAGELYRQAGNFAASNEMWFSAETQIQAWEKAATLDPVRVFSYMGASTINDQIKVYEGQDYEKTWLNTRIALNFLAQNNWDDARVAIKRTHEREAIIATFREQEFNALQQDAENEGWSLLGDNLGSYPVQYIQSPEVLALHNSYQNLFSHYLAGFIYEALNEPSLAAPGYRNAIELNPSSNFLKAGLEGLEQRLQSTVNPQQTDVLFVLETGDAPARIPFNVSLPFYYGNSEGELQSILISIAFPIIQPSPPISPITIALGKKTMIAEPVMDLNLMARRALHDEMPGLIFRGMTRAASKGALQYYGNQAHPFLGLAAALFSVVTERADDRIWRTLPGHILLARSDIPSGSYPLRLNGADTQQNIHISGRYAIVVIRIYKNLAVVNQVSTYGTLNNSPTTQER